jgi:NAD(P)-dependent dehydrogenase (short-subunit alcohol dehydrogenase family)
MAKVVLITGASAGIGSACADRLEKRNWTVIGGSRRGTSSGGWSPMVMDVDDDESVKKAVAAVVGEHGRIDAVVASAGWGLAGAVELTPVAEAKDRVLPVMRRQGGGRIVLMSSIGGIIGIPFQAFYSASKFALEGYGEALAYEVAPFGIQVTLVEPGNVRTDFTSSRRDVATPDPDGTYTAAVTKAVGLMEKDEANGVDPGVVAAVVEKVLGSSRPRRRVSVGKMDERVGIMGKRVLPYRFFEWAAKSSLGV